MAEKLHKKRKHRWWKGLLITLASIVAIIAIPVGVVFGCFYNANFNYEFEDTGEDMNNVFSRIMSSCLDDIKDDGNIDFKISEKDFNQLLIPTINENLTPAASQFLRGFYLDITDDKYNFVIGIKENYVNIFKTKIVLVTELEHIKSQNIEEDMFVFRIVDLKLGNINNMMSFGKTLLRNFGADTFIQDFFRMSGLNIQLDLNNNCMTYLTHQLVEDVLKMIGQQNEQFMTIFNSVIELTMQNHSFGFDFYTDETLELYLELEKFSTNDRFVYDKTSPVDLDLEKHMEDLLVLIKNHIVTVEDAGKLLHYLIHGYELTDASNREFVDNLDLSIIGIHDVHAYAGDKFPDEVSLTDEATSQIKNANLAQGHLASVSESFLNDMVSSSSVMGYSLLIPGKDIEGNDKLAYLTIDKFYINLQNDKLSAVARMNINGYHTYLIFDYVEDLSNTDHTKIVLNPVNIYFGKIEAPQNLISTFYTILGEAFSEIKNASFDKNTGTIEITFQEAFDEAGNFELIKNYGEPIISIKGNDLTADGEISLDIAKN